jgi:hypothetical protein
MRDSVAGIEVTSSWQVTAGSEHFGELTCIAVMKVLRGKLPNSCRDVIGGRFSSILPPSQTA